jgi:hypothetical protein
MRTDAHELWGAVDELVSQAPSVAALRHHRLELLAARHRRAAGLDVEPRLHDAERAAAVQALSARHLLKLIRSAVDQPLILMKGPEVAASYRFPECRPFGDLDILTPDADAVFAALLRAGFTEIGVSDAGHHAPPLAWRGFPLTIEIHSTPKFISQLTAPPIDELLRLTCPSRTGVPGIEGFVPAAHAVLLAVHAWAHVPLQCVGQMIDIAAVLSETDRGSADEVARSWGCHRLWQTTCATIDGLLLGGTRSIPLRTWARHLLSTREPRVVERSLSRIAGPAWALPRRAVPAGVRHELLCVTRGYDWETRDEHLLRARHALRHPFKPVSELGT